MSRAGQPRRDMAEAHAVTILVVEDEVLVRMGIVDDLVWAGHSVIEAANADEALSVLEAGHHVDVVFSDVHMPGTLDGLGLMEIIRRRFPSIAVILTSGLEIPSPDILGDEAAFIPKPYAAGIVLDLVGRVQARRRSEKHGPHARSAQAGDPAD